MKNTLLAFLAFAISIGVYAQKKVKLEDNTNASNFYFNNGKVGIGKLPSGAELSLGKKTGSDGSLTRLSLEPPKHTGGPWKYITRDAGAYAYLDQYYGAKQLLTFRHDGKIGIGKQPTDAELSVGRKTGSDGSLTRLSLEPPKHTGGPWKYITRDAGAYAYLDQYYGAKHLLTFRHDGKVGIGTKNTGSHKLAVEGSVGAREIQVEASGWSDFVFEKEYSLPTLLEVENHIKENGHLKDIPSEAEVIKNGIFLGEMDAKLLQKIEELTLYTIQQQKEIQNLKKENNELKSLSKRLNEIETLLKPTNRSK